MKCSELSFFLISIFFFMRAMAPKGKKEKKSTPKKQDSETLISWPEDFPKQLRQWRIQRSISWGEYGVCKSWRYSVSKQCKNSTGNTPQLQISCTANHSRIQGEEVHGKSQPHQFQRIPFLPPGFYNSWRNKLVNRSLCSSSSTSLFITSSYETYTPGSTMVLTGVSRPALLFLRPPHHDPVQVEHLDSKIIDPYDQDKQSIIFTNAIWFKGKFYALSLQGALAVVEQVDSSFTITGFGKNRAIPSMPSRQFTEYLIESNEEILLVFLISGKSISTIEYVEAVKLDHVTLSWVKIDSLGDKALFLAGTNRGMSVSANQVGFKSNHIYFNHQGINSWKEFDMESRSISPCCNF